MQPDRDLPEPVPIAEASLSRSDPTGISHRDIIVHTKRYEETVLHYSSAQANSKTGSGVTHLNQSTGHLLMLKSWSECHF